VIENGYSVERSSSGLEFTFVSTGPKGSVKKYIIFKPMDKVANVFNMGFGDITREGWLSDSVVTNNHDLRMVVGALVSSINMFFESHPTKSIFIIGNSSSRTRLYRITISSNFDSVNDRFFVYGFISGGWEAFARNRPYDAYLIQLKNIVTL
jgi:hypothetical protein